MMRSKIALLLAGLLAAAPAVAQDYNQANTTLATNEVSAADVNVVEPVAPANDMIAVPQAVPAAEPVTTPAPAPRKEGFPWGLIGLVGLVGLLGRMRR